MPYKLHQAQACPEFLREKGGRSERRETYLDIGFVPQHFVDVVKMLPDHRFDTEGGQGRRVAQALLRRIRIADRFMFGDEQIRIYRLQRRVERLGAGPGRCDEKGDGLHCYPAPSVVATDQNIEA